MTRHLDNWLNQYVAYASCTEAPRITHFWAGVSAIAGALRRRVWFEQVKFRWYPGFFIIFVGPPGVITKSTTADGSMDLLREVPGIHFGPDSVTWQSLVTSFAASAESFEYEGSWYPMSAITLLASEFGNLIDFQDSAMVNLFITLWDGRNRYEKQTKVSGNDMVEAPWINLLACTTPQWIAANMNQTTIGGGFTSRCVFVYGDKKERPIAYIEDAVGTGYEGLREALVRDLEHISLNIAGPYRLSPEAKAWGIAWYERLWGEVYNTQNPDWVNGYLARKQAHLHKLAMVMSAAHRDDRVIDLRDLELANTMLTSTEEKFDQIFSKIGRTQESLDAGAVLDDITRAAAAAGGAIFYEDMYKLIQVRFPNAKDFEGVFATFVRAGQLKLVNDPASGRIKIKVV